MKASGESDSLAAVNRVPIHRALVFADEASMPTQLAPYLTILDKYNPAKLDPRRCSNSFGPSIRPGSIPGPPRLARPGSSPNVSPRTRNSALAMVRLVGGLFRDRIDDPAAALAFWQAAMKVLRPESWKAECEIEAADIALYELLQPEPAKKLLDSARLDWGRGRSRSSQAASTGSGATGMLARGTRPSARAAYDRATAVLDSRKSAVEQDAWRGALSRSTEEFLRNKAFDRAWSELRKWQEEYPIDKVEGYLTLLQARYWAARSRWPQAIALAGDLVAINPESPYADRLTYLAAECEEKQGRADRARAGYQSLITDYPGSPLVSDAKKKIAVLAKKPAGAGGKP